MVGYLRYIRSLLHPLHKIVLSICDLSQCHVFPISKSRLFKVACSNDKARFGVFLFLRTVILSLTLKSDEIDPT